MAENSSIEWTQATWNPTVGCTWAGPECDHCYAVQMTRRLAAMGQANYQGLVTDKHFNGTVRALEHKLSIPLKRKKPQVYFVDSMSDLFHKDVPFKFIDKVMAVAAIAPQHTYQILTKRPDRMADYLGQEYLWQTLHEAVKHRMGYGNPKRPAINRCDLPLNNIWFGTSVGVVKAKSRIDHLRDVPAAVRFLSLEPLLEDLGELDLTGIGWVIVGGESGHGARPCNVAWIRSIRDQCQAAGVPCFIKQLGSVPCDDGFQPAGGWWKDQRAKWHDLIEGTWMTGRCLRDKKGGDWNEWPEDLRVREYPSRPQPS